MAHTYNVSTGAWIQDTHEGWVSSKVVSKNVEGDKATLVFEIASGDRIGEVWLSLTASGWGTFEPASIVNLLCRKSPLLQHLRLLREMRRIKAFHL